ncbi:hypothetical protein CG709_18710, partial [Lachnotalea glycerini]
MKKIKKAILDSGVNSTFYHRMFGDNIKESYSIYINASKNSIEVKDYGFEDFNGHGTACAITIKKLAPNVEIVPIQILSKDGKGSIEQLMTAMELVKNIDVQLINMSVSSDIDNLIFKLQPIVRSINEQGKICIAAKSNSRSVSIPAEMKEIIGVESSIAIFGTKFKYCKENKIQLLGSGTPELMGYNTKNINFFKGNSKATAVITG